MPINKIVSSFAEAVKDIPDGATVMVGGFAGAGGMPSHLLAALRDQGAKNLTIISNTAGLTGGYGVRPGEDVIDPRVLVLNGQVRKFVASFPVSSSPSNPTPFEKLYVEGKAELELVPQGTLAERIRAGGAGIGGFYTPTGVGTLIAQGKETRVIDGKEYLFEKALRAQFALVRAYKADAYGNLIYRKSARNFNVPMAMAAEITIVEVDEIMEPGGLDPEMIVTPGIFVKRVVKRVQEVADESQA